MVQKKMGKKKPYKRKYHKDITRWLPLLEKDRDYDFAYIFIILQFKLKNMKEYLEKYGVHLHKQRDIKNINLAILTLDRLIKEDYILQENHVFTKIPNHFRKIGKTYRSDYLKKQDIEFLCKIFIKHIQEWWD